MTTTMWSSEACEASSWDDLGWTTHQVRRITGASQRRLEYWLDKGIISADVDEARGRGRVRLWSFTNLVEVRIAVWLRERVTLDVIGSVISQLTDDDILNPVPEMHFSVVVTSDDTGATRSVYRSTDGRRSGSETEESFVMDLAVSLERFVTEVREAAQREGAKRRTIKERAMPRTAYMAASAIRALYYEGWPAQRIIDAYPGVTATEIGQAVRGATANRP